MSSNPFFIHNDLKSLNCTLKSTEVEHQADRKRRYYRDLGRNREVWRNTWLSSIVLRDLGFVSTLDPFESPTKKSARYCQVEPQTVFVEWNTYQWESFLSAFQWENIYICFYIPLSTDHQTAFITLQWWGIQEDIFLRSGKSSVHSNPTSCACVFGVTWMTDV